MPMASTSRMRRIVASSDCLFKFVGGRRNMPLEIACGLCFVSFIHSRNEERYMYLITLTDQPRFLGSELSVSRSADLVLAFKTFESVQ